MCLCVAFIATGALLAVAGLGGAWTLLPAVGCAAMMGMMIWMMLGMRHGGHDSDHITHRGHTPGWYGWVRRRTP